MIILSLLLAGCGSKIEQLKTTNIDDYVRALPIYSEIGGKNLKMLASTPGDCEACVEFEYVFDPSDEGDLGGTVTVIVSTKVGKIVDSKIIDNTLTPTTEVQAKQVNTDAEMDAYEDVYHYALRDGRFVEQGGKNLRFIQKDSLSSELGCENCYDFLFVYDIIEVDPITGEENYVEEEVSYIYKDGKIQ